MLVKFTLNLLITSPVFQLGDKLSRSNLIPPIILSTVSLSIGRAKTLQIHTPSEACAMYSGGMLGSSVS